VFAKGGNGADHSGDGGATSNTGNGGDAEYGGGSGVVKIRYKFQ
jgi:hypothetical protein